MTNLADTFVGYVRPHLGRLRAVAREYASGPEEEQDLLQETLLRAWRGFSPSEEKTYRPAWLFVILRRVAWEWRWQATRRVHLVPLVDAELTELTAAQEALRLAEANFRAGMMTTLDVLAAQESLAQARLRHAEAVVRYNQSQVNLLAALGLLDAEALLSP